MKAVDKLKCIEHINPILFLKEINEDIWKHIPPVDNGYGYSRVVRRLTSTERKSIVSMIKDFRLPCRMFTMYNQGVGIVIYENDPSMGISPYPGVEFNYKELNVILSIWEDHIFDDEAPRYRLRRRYPNKNKFYYNLFKKIVDIPENLEMLRRYNFPDPLIQPLSHFEY